MSNSKKTKLTPNEKQAYQKQKSLFFWIILSCIPNAFSFFFPSLEIASILISSFIFPLFIIFLWDDLFNITPEKNILIKNKWINNILITIYFCIASYLTFTWIAYSLSKQECMKRESWDNIRQCLQEAEKNRFTTFR